MGQPVEVATFHQGVQQSSRVLSKRSELRAGWTAAAAAAAATGGLMVAFAALTYATGFVLHTPSFVMSWLTITGLVTSHAFHRARQRTRRYHIGARMDADAFSGAELDLVTGDGRGGYSVALVAGMSGQVAMGSTRRPIEALTVPGQIVHVPICQGAQAWIEQDQTTFVIRGVSLQQPAPQTQGDAVVVPVFQAPGLGPRRFASEASMLAPLAAVFSLFFCTPAAVALGDRDLLSRIPVTATLHQAEKHLRWQAQLQAQALHECFDPLPLSCHKPGYVGVGLRLDATGAVLESWVARTTYDEACPVTACMETLIGQWYFEPIPEGMRLVLPVQVLQTRTPDSLYVPVKLAESVEDKFGELPDAPTQWTVYGTVSPQR